MLDQQAVQGEAVGISTPKYRLSCISSAVLTLLTWGLTNAQTPPPAQASGGAQAPADTPKIPGQNPNGLQVYLRAGLKTHGPGLHDYPQFLAD